MGWERLTTTKRKSRSSTTLGETTYWSLITAARSRQRERRRGRDPPVRFVYEIRDGHDQSGRALHRQSQALEAAGLSE